MKRIFISVILSLSSLFSYASDTDKKIVQVDCGSVKSISRGTIPYYAKVTLRLERVESFKLQDGEIISRLSSPGSLKIKHTAFINSTDPEELRYIVMIAHLIEGAYIAEDIDGKFCIEQDRNDQRGTYLMGLGLTTEDAINVVIDQM